MPLARRTLLASLTALIAAPAMLRLARADAPPVTLKLHHFFSSVSGGHERFLVPWARKVEAESGGRIRIDIFPSMQLGGAPAQLIDQARDGLADIVWAVPGNTPGRFAKIEAFELPFAVSRRALVNSRAIEDYAAAYLQDEFHEIHPICFSCRDRGVVHTDRAVRSIAELKGLRLHVTNRLAGEAVRALGAYGVSVPVPQVPMALAGHAIDGCLDPWDVVPSLRLGDLLKFHTDFAESSLSTSTFVLAMNKAAYEKLPRDLKAVIDANSGQDAAGMAGAMWDLEAKTVADAARERGDPIAILTAEEIAHWRRAIEPVVALWLKQMKERKLDGGKLIAGARALIAKYANEPEPQALQAPQPPQTSEPKVVSEPPPSAPQAKAEVMAPKPDAPTPAPPVKRAPPKELDIPL
ncbi:MAG: TRAP transporter substrate-binding protein DctP [Xanthobacteraceae bacterium]|nr:TRAP transporter substrate-binding protein DctP [Xanthobacteraceae bacterium]